MKVLVVDDSKAVRTRIVRLLRGLEGVEVVGQTSEAREAISAIKSLNPQAVVLDISLPDTSGFEVLDAYRADPKRPAFLVFTNWATAQYRRRSLEAGAVHFFDKAHDVEKMLDVIAAMGRSNGSNKINAADDTSSRESESNSSGGKPYESGHS